MAQGEGLPVKNEKVRLLIIDARAKEQAIVQTPTQPPPADVHVETKAEEPDQETSEFDRKMALFNGVFTCYDDALQYVRAAVLLAPSACVHACALFTSLIVTLHRQLRTETK